jgi:hypothetical protein
MARPAETAATPPLRRVRLLRPVDAITYLLAWIAL